MGHLNGFLKRNLKKLIILFCSIVSSSFLITVNAKNTIFVTKNALGLWMMFGRLRVNVH